MPDIFLKLDTINGESQDQVHKDEIDVLSFSWGVSNPGAGAYGKGSGASRSSLSDVAIQKRADAASPALFKAAATGLTVGDAIITARKAGGKEPVEYLVYKLTEVFVSGVQTSAADGGEIAHESISLNFSKLEVNYTLQNADGSKGATTTTSYNVKENVAT